MNTPTPANPPAVFSFDNHNVRTLLIDDQPWFIAADVCEALELGNTTRALERLDEDEQALISIQGMSRGNDQVNIINESGLYSLVLGSRKPSAKRFKKWVTAEVLPAIRKTGRYEAKSYWSRACSGTARTAWCSFTLRKASTSTITPTACICGARLA